MITAVLTVVVCLCLFYEQVELPLLIPLCLIAGMLIAYLQRHQHSETLSIDVMAQASRMNQVNPLLKLATTLTLMFLCIASQTVITGLFLAVVMVVLARFAGGIKTHQYMHVFALPLSFLMLGALTLLINVSSEPGNLLNLNVAGIWLSVTTNTQTIAGLVIARALGAVSCLCVLSMTTPMSDIIGVLKKIHCPIVVIDLMYLIYRYLFILLSLHRDMRNAARSRLGFKDYRNNVRSTGMIYANLLSRSYQSASLSYDAMESRCYQDGIAFLEQHVPVRFGHVVTAAVAGVICVFFFAASFFALPILPF